VNTPASRTTEQDLSGLAERINAEHAACLSAAKDAITRAIEVGRLLTDAKARVQHGEWAAWVEANCDFGVRQASSYMRAYACREQIGSGASDFTSLRGAMEALAVPVARDEEDGDSRPRCVPVTEWSPEHRKWTCDQWWDQLATFTMMFDAAGWEADEIADFLGRPVEDVEAILDPPLPVPRRNFDVWPDGDCLIDSDEPGARGVVAALYADGVMYMIDGWLEKACLYARIRCKIDGFDHVEPILRDRERRYRRRQEGAERRGLGPFPFLKGRALQASAALHCCVTRDARHAMRIGLDEGWDPELMPMWMRLAKALEDLGGESAEDEDDEE
jgi:hypothetical protein